GLQGGTAALLHSGCGRLRFRQRLSAEAAALDYRNAKHPALGPLRAALHPRAVGIGSGGVHCAIGCNRLRVLRSVHSDADCDDLGHRHTRIWPARALDEALADSGLGFGGSLPVACELCGASVPLARWRVRNSPWPADSCGGSGGGYRTIRDAGSAYAGRVASPFGNAFLIAIRRYGFP